MERLAALDQIHAARALAAVLRLPAMRDAADALAKQAGVFGGFFAAEQAASEALAPAMIFFAVENRAEHSGFVTSRRRDEEWTYQDVTGAHGAVIAEGTKSECETALSEALRCGAAERGTYCYTHNPIRQ